MSITSKLVCTMHRVFQWRRLQRLVVPQERYGERSEPALKRKRLSQPRKESEPLGAPTRCSPSIVSRSGSVSSLSFAVRDAFSYAGFIFTLQLCPMLCKTQKRSSAQARRRKKAGRRRRHYSNAHEARK